ncbi:putative B3 domain-containing protein-like [Capsicum annuum]|nr:putative B3 domain-containing protein-like [Capsicum annuum]KAF3667188.1 putative B3 domain-containing protein-like [Capsicum annuum]
MSKVGGSIISEFYSAEFTNAVPSAMSASDVVIRGEGHHRPKLKCRILDPEYCFLLPHVLGAYFEKLGSKSFAVYSIAVTDVNNNTWFVKRRYRNFERLDRHLKDIPNYTLHLPPKRIFSSSTEDAFVHQHCIQLDKYLQDLLTIANVAEQHEVWDFLSASSKNFFSTLMMFMQNYDHKKVLKQKDVIGWRKANDYEKFLAVLRRNFINVDDAVDDIVRQFKGVSDGLMHKVLGSPSSSYEPTTCTSDRHLSWNVEEINKLASTQSTSESVNSFSDNDDSDKDGNHGQEEVGPSSEANGLHSDNELNSKESPPPVGSGGFPETSLAVVPSQQEDPVGVPPEVSLSSSSPFSTSCLSVCDFGFSMRDIFKLGSCRPSDQMISTVFHLTHFGRDGSGEVDATQFKHTYLEFGGQDFSAVQKRLAKEIMQLMMEDAIDDWLLRHSLAMERRCYCSRNKMDSRCKHLVF